MEDLCDHCMYLHDRARRRSDALSETFGVCTVTEVYA